MSRKRLWNKDEWKDHSQLPAINIRDCKDNANHRSAMGYFKHLAYSKGITQAEMLTRMVSIYHKYSYLDNMEIIYDGNNERLKNETLKEKKNRK